MSLSDDLDGLLDPQPNEPTPRVEWSDNTGTVQTGAVGDDFNPHDLTAVLNQFGADLHRYGYDESTHTLELAGGTTWEQSRRDRETNEFETIRLHAYRYRCVPRPLAIDLPALYAEVAKTRPVAPKKPTGAASVVVCYSDVQLGKQDRLGGIKELLERLDEKRAALDQYLRRTKHDHIVIADCGDIIEGFENTSSQTRTNCLSLMDQVDIAATEFWKMIRLCASHAPVDVLSIPSNHCRWAKGKNLIGKSTDDWGLHISKRLERQNDPEQGGPGLPVTFHRSEDWEETLQFDVRGTRIGLVHGHQAANPDKVRDWWAKMTHAGILNCQVLVSGHFHFPSLRPSGKDYDTGKSKWHIQASTIDNGSAWVRNKMGEDGDPALTVFTIDDEGFDVQGFALL